MSERRIEVNNIAIKDLLFKIKNIEEEMIFFVEAFNKLSETEAMKQWDSIEVQTEYWNAKLKEEINYRLLMKMPIDAEILKTALALPDTEVRKYVVDLLNQKNF